MPACPGMLGAALRVFGGGLQAVQACWGMGFRVSWYAGG